MADKRKNEYFAVKDCTLASIATGRHAQNLRELRDHLLVVHPGSIYFHFWGGLLRPSFEDPEYNNDFASWAAHALNDNKLAERLGVIDPAQFSDIEALRQEVVDEIEQRLDETEFLTWAKRDQQFHLIRSQIVVFDTRIRLKQPQDLLRAVPELTVGSIFYHFIDARWRSPERIDDFRAWLNRFGPCGELCRQLAAIDPYFVNLVELRAKLVEVFTEYLKEERYGRIA